ncbi:MAG: Thymidylate synthase, partial [Candidatus Bathyarchaeota archaeon B63]
MAGSDGADRGEKPSLIFIYSGDYAERVIRNLINDPSFCKPCGIHCDYCKYNIYTYVNEIKAAVELPSPSELPSFIDEPERYMPKMIPKAEICVASGLHKDLLLALPGHIREAGVKAMIVPVEDFVEVPSGLKRQLEERCADLA